MIIKQCPHSKSKKIQFSLSFTTQPPYNFQTLTLCLPCLYAMCSRIPVVRNTRYQIDARYQPLRTTTLDHLMCTVLMHLSILCSTPHPLKTYMLQDWWQMTQWCHCTWSRVNKANLQCMWNHLLLDWMFSSDQRCRSWDIRNLTPSMTVSHKSCYK